MYLNYERINETSSISSSSDRNFHIIGCGKLNLFDKNEFSVNKPRGTECYQMIYISAGKVTFHFGNAQNSSVLDSGNLILFHPYENKQYECYSIDNPEIYWIDFTGTEVESILKSIEMDKNIHSYFVGSSLEYNRLFKRINWEIKLKKEFYEEMISMLFKHFLIITYRKRKNLSQFNNFQYIQKMDQASQYFNDHYTDNNSIKQYAESDGLSLSWFIKKFKEFTGLTPDQYIIDIRINNAKKLLEETTYSIKEISNYVGYENQLYFSRLFHKHTGLSPKEYRKNCMKKLNRYKKEN